MKYDKNYTLKKVILSILVAAMDVAYAEDFDGSAIVYGGGVVEFTGVSWTNWVHNASTGANDFILAFTSTNPAVGSFTLPGSTKARILAVGGGGGGGGTCSSAGANQPNGGGGGGGAGGMMETNGVFGAGVYSVSVGAGGAAGLRIASHSTTGYPGSDGGDTTVLLGAETLLSAKGGGGGGGECDGNSGGSGGGGSMYKVSSTTGNEHTGGAGFDGQGRAGGLGDAYNYGGGGGGAGGAGSPGSVPGGGVGGVGLASDITSVSVIYASGGGGGCNNLNVMEPADGIAGGDGSTYGRGGVGSMFAATAGEDGKGGGGGGAGRSAPGARGGNGVVIVRIAAVLLPTVSNVSVTASAPWDGKVEVFFTVANDLAAACPDWNQPYLSIVAADNETGSNYVSSAIALSGDTGAEAGPHAVTWDLAAQGIDFFSTNVTFTVAYLKMPDYCVIDLSGILPAPIDLSNGIDHLTEQELMAAKLQVESDIASAQAAINDSVEERTDVEAQLQAVENTYNNAGYNNTDLAQLEQDVKDLMVQEAAARQAVADDSSQKYLTVSNYYRDYAQPLAKAILKYYLVYTGEVSVADLDKVEISEWFNQGYYDKHFCVRYLNNEGMPQERFFDFVTCDAAGQPLIKESLSDKFDDTPSNVTGIVVLEKTPTYAFHEAGDNTKPVIVEDTDANRSTYKAQINASTMKYRDVGGNHYIISQRTGWGTATAEDSVKGALKIDLNAGKEAVELSRIIQDLTYEIQEINSKIDASNTRINELTALKSAIEGRLGESGEAVAVLGVACPVTYFDAPPDGGFTNDLYRTTNLVMRLVGPESDSARPFYCAVFETTQRQWELVTGARPSYFTNETCYATRPVEKVSWNMIRGDAGTYDWPTTNAVDESSFVGVLRQKTGLDALDLPTEAQWEYACRAGKTTTYSYGDDANGDYMWYADNSTDQTHTVGTKLPNAWGLYDMHGNVWEWCLDRRQSSESDRVLRGGSWNHSADFCTSSSRGGLGPLSVFDFIGFRLVRTLSDNPEGERGAEAAAGAARAGTVCAGASAAITVVTDPPVVSNVVARQRWPWNGLVDIDYEIGGYTAGLKVEIEFDEQGGLSRHWVATNFIADAEPTLNRGHNRATWDTKAAGVTNVIATNVIAIVSLLRMPIVDIASGMYADAFSEVDFTTPNESNYFINEDTLEAYRVPTENSKGDVQTIASLLKDVFGKNELSTYSGFKYANGNLSLYKSFTHLQGTDDTVSTETFEKAFAVTSAMADTDFKHFAGLYEDVQDYINNGGSYDKLTFKYKSDGTATLTQSVNIDRIEEFNTGDIANLDEGDILSMLAKFESGYTIGNNNASDISYEDIAEAAGSTAGQVNSNSRVFTQDEIDAAIEIKRVIDQQYATIDQANKNTANPDSFKLVSISGDDGLILKYTSTETEERSFPEASSTRSATYKRVADAVLTANDYTNGYVINGSAPAYVFKNKDMYGKSYYVENDNLKKTFKGDVEKTVNFLKAVYPDETRNITFDPNAEYTMEIEQNGTIKLSHNGLEE